MFDTGTIEAAEENRDCIICKLTGGAVEGAAMHMDARYDRGIEIDKDMWYSVTPEPIAKEQARKVAAAQRGQPGIVVDSFCGAGGQCQRCSSSKMLSAQVDTPQAEAHTH
eukprot:s562_g4.t1